MESLSLILASKGQGSQHNTAKIVKLYHIREKGVGQISGFRYKFSFLDFFSIKRPHPASPPKAGGVFCALGGGLKEGKHWVTEICRTPGESTLCFYCPGLNGLTISRAALSKLI